MMTKTRDQTAITMWCNTLSERLACHILVFFHSSVWVRKFHSGMTLTLAAVKKNPQKESTKGGLGLLKMTLIS